MVLDTLGTSLKNSLKKIANAVFIDDKLINEIIKDIQKALLQSDVNVKLVLELTKEIKERALKEKEPAKLSKKEHIVNIVYEELTKFVGSEFKKLKIKKPFKLMFVGLFGQGKTTTIGKLGKYFKNRSHKVAAISLDIQRPAALAQLKQLGKKAGFEVFGDKKIKNPTKIYTKFSKELNKFDIILIDTAGRDALSKDLIKELKSINKTVKPSESFLVIGADVGQAAEKQAESFKNEVNVTGVVITKMEGTAKGGGALAACKTTKSPIRFIGVGENLDDIEEFKPEGFVGRLLGMGDLEALLEKAKISIDEDQVKDLGKKFLKGDFTLIDLYDQMQSMKKLGPLTKVVDMIPGMGGKVPKELLKNQEGKIEKWKFMMDSMTKQELEDPSKLGSSKLDRISKGSGVKHSELREMIKQYKQSRKMMKMLKGKEKNMSKLMKKFGG